MEIDRNLIWFLGLGIFGVFLANTVFYPKALAAAEREAMAKEKAERAAAAVYTPLTEEQVAEIRAKYIDNFEDTVFQGPTQDIDYEVVSEPIMRPDRLLGLHLA